MLIVVNKDFMEEAGVRGKDELVDGDNVDTDDEIHVGVLIPH